MEEGRGSEHAMSTRAINPSRTLCGLSDGQRVNRSRDPRPSHGRFTAKEPDHTLKTKSATIRAFEFEKSDSDCWAYSGIKHQSTSKRIQKRGDGNESVRPRPRPRLCPGGARGV